jgi:hypothetical protein
MSALGQKQAFAPQKTMSALPPKADIELSSRSQRVAGRTSFILFRQRFPGKFKRPIFKRLRFVADSVMRAYVGVTLDKHAKLLAEQFERANRSRVFGASAAASAYSGISMQISSGDACDGIKNFGQALRLSSCPHHRTKAKSRVALNDQGGFFHRIIGSASV